MDKQTKVALDRGISAYRAHYRKIEDAMPEQIRALASVAEYWRARAQLEVTKQ